MNSSTLSLSDNKMQKALRLIVHFAHLHSHVRVIARLKGDIKDTGKGPNMWTHPISFAASVENVNLFQCPVPVSRGPPDCRAVPILLGGVFMWLWGWWRLALWLHKHVLETIKDFHFWRSQVLVCHVLLAYIKVRTGPIVWLPVPV